MNQEYYEEIIEVEDVENDLIYEHRISAKHYIINLYSNGGRVLEQSMRIV